MLTNSQKAVFRTLLKNKRSIWKYTTFDIAEQSMVSMPTVTKTCKTLGYKGYRDLQKKESYGTNNITILEILEEIFNIEYDLQRFEEDDRHLVIPNYMLNKTYCFKLDLEEFPDSYLQKQLATRIESIYMYLKLYSGQEASEEMTEFVTKKILEEIELLKVKTVKEI